MNKLTFFSLMLLIMAGCATPRIYSPKQFCHGITETFTLVEVDGSDQKNLRYQEKFLNKVITEGYYFQLKKEGKWNYYDLEGKLNFSGYFSNGEKHGEWIYFNDGNLSSELYFTHGERDSVFGYDKSGNLISEMRRIGDQVTRNRYLPNGQLIEAYQGDANQDGITSLFFENGRLHRRFSHRDGKISEVLETFDLQGNPIDGGTLFDGRGSYVTYYPPKTDEDSLLSILAVLNYSEGVIDGPLRYFYRNGNIYIQGNTNEGKQTGTWKFYDEQGIAFLIDFPFSGIPHNLPDHISLDLPRNPDLYYLMKISELSDVQPQMPSFQGGESAFVNFLIKNTVYPVSARHSGAQGIVFLTIVIDEIGDINDIEVLRGLQSDIDEEAIRVIRCMPRWNPGLIYGIPTKVRFNMPFRFSLSG